MNIPLESNWKQVLKGYLKKPEFKKLWHFIENEYRNKTVYPERKNVFNALNSTPFSTVSVVIIGQDPYHNPGQAHGLCFSVQDGITPPPSLKNIFKEIITDCNIKKDFANGNLSSWTEQGVLLLNSVLTVEENKPGSHSKKGWEEFTNYVIEQISHKKEHVVFLLWGNYAKQKGIIIDRERHLVLESSHPSPLGAYRGFIGCKLFSQTNKYLKKYAKEPIEW